MQSADSTAVLLDPDRPEAAERQCMQASKAVKVPMWGPGVAFLADSKPEYTHLRGLCSAAAAAARR